MKDHFRQGFEQILSERDLEDAVSNARRYGDGRGEQRAQEALDWLRGGSHRNEDLLRKMGHVSGGSMIRWSPDHPSYDEMGQ